MKTNTFKETRKTEVSNIEYCKKTQYLSWEYDGKEYWCQGEFYIDGEGYLHHSFYPEGEENEVEFKVFVY